MIRRLPAPVSVRGNGGIPGAWRPVTITGMTTTAISECETTGQPGKQNRIELPLGLLGFEPIKKYLLIENFDEAPFLWLQMIEAPQHAFLVVPPATVVADYQPELSDEDVQFLGLESPEDAWLVNIVTLRPGRASTVNLKGPIVLNRRTLVAKQVIPLNATCFPLQHPLPAVG
jgi:flagellar assembly factor FliW